MNGLQKLSVTGIIFSIIVHIILLLINKHIDDMWLLYPTWTAVFLVGLIFRITGKDQIEEHHH
ncbi:MAG: hypothetical protein ACK40G_04025 [Cytophagaceae bacterium]